MVDSEKIIGRVNNPILFILLAAFLFGLGSVLSKKVGYAYADDSIHPLQIVYARFFFALIIVSLIVFLRDRGLKDPISNCTSQDRPVVGPVLLFYSAG